MSAFPPSGGSGKNAEAVIKDVRGVPRSSDASRRSVGVELPLLQNLGPGQSGRNVTRRVSSPERGAVQMVKVVSSRTEGAWSMTRTSGQSGENASPGSRRGRSVI